MYRIVYYQNARGDCPVLKFIDTLDEKAAIKVLAFVELLQEKGPHLLRPLCGQSARARQRTARTVGAQTLSYAILLYE